MIIDALSVGCANAPFLWHRRYGHLDSKSLKSLHHNKMVVGLPMNNDGDGTFVKIAFMVSIIELPFRLEKHGEQSYLLSWIGAC